MNARTSLPATAEVTGALSEIIRADEAKRFRSPPVSRVGNAAYALEKASIALLWASTPIGREVAQREYDAALADMRALIAPELERIAS